jgi:hypothetical protein
VSRVSRRRAWAAIAAAAVIGLALGNATMPILPDPTEGLPVEPAGPALDVLTLTPARVARARRVAVRVWGPVCGGRVRIGFGTLQQPGQAAEARYAYAPTRSLDERRYTDCRVVIARGRRWPPEVLCGLVVHEYGHLAGRGHSRDPRKVMYPRLSRRNIPRSCR